MCSQSYDLKRVIDIKIDEGLNQIECKVLSSANSSKMSNNSYQFVVSKVPQDNDSLYIKEIDLRIKCITNRGILKIIFYEGDSLPNARELFSFNETELDQVSVQIEEFLNKYLSAKDWLHELQSVKDANLKMERENKKLKELVSKLSSKIEKVIEIISED